MTATTPAGGSRSLADRLKDMLLVGGALLVAIIVVMFIGFWINVLIMGRQDLNREISNCEKAGGQVIRHTGTGSPEIGGGVPIIECKRPS